MRISDWSSDVCSSDLLESPVLSTSEFQAMRAYMGESATEIDCTFDVAGGDNALRDAIQTIRRRAERSEEHTSELQSLMRISYAVFCLKKKKNQNTTRTKPIANH